LTKARGAAPFKKRFFEQGGKRCLREGVLNKADI
jgi:hypothetical protein